MFTMSEHYIIIAEREMGPKCRAILNGYLGSSGLTQIAGDSYKIRLSSAEEQEKLYQQFKAAMHLDFPADAEIKRIRAENERLRDRLSEEAEDAAPADEPPATVHSMITEVVGDDQLGYQAMNDSSDSSMIFLEGIQFAPVGADGKCGIDDEELKNGLQARIHKAVRQTYAALNAIADEPPATVHSIITAALRRLGADGLCTEGCGCGLADLAPCGHMGMHCVPARCMTIAEAIARGYDTHGHPHPCVAYYVPLNSIDHNSADQAQKEIPCQES